MKNEKITVEQQALLKLLRKHLFNEKVEFSDCVDWNDVLNESISQAIQGVFVSFDDPSNAEFKTKANSIVSSVLRNSIMNFHEHSLVHNILTNAGIDYVVLKGVASASYYAKPEYRSMGDVDVLVPLDRFDEACKLMESNGYLGEYNGHPCHVEFHKGKSIVEIHKQPNGIPDDELGDIIRSYFEDIFKKSQKGEYNLPSEFHHGLIMICHVWKHMTHSGVGLRHLCDWAVFVNKFSDDEFKTIFEEKFKAVGLWRLAQVLTQLSIVYLGVQEKSWAMENVDYNNLELHILDCFNQGNFGRKNTNTMYAGFMINKGKSGQISEESNFKMLLSNITRLSYYHYPITKKYPILLPYGFIRYAFRVSLKVLKGKRKMFNIIKESNEADKRKKIYKYCETFVVKK